MKSTVGTRRSGLRALRRAAAICVLGFSFGATELPGLDATNLPLGVSTSYAQTDRAAAKKLDQEIAVAKRMLRSGQSSAGLEKIRTLLDEYPADVRLLRLYSAQLRTEDRLEESIPYYRKAVDAADEGGPILQELEGILRELRRDEEAFDACLAYQERYGERGRWVQRELESLLLTGRLGDVAVKKIDEALKGRDAESPLHRLRLTALYFAGRKEEALESVGKLDRERNAGGAELYAYSTLLEDRGDLDDALGALQAALLSDPKPALGQEMLYKQAQLLRRLRRVDEALGVFDQIVSAHPDGALTRNILLEKAQILDVELHRKEEALATYRDLLTRIQPIKTADDAQLVNRIQLSMADCELLLGRPEKAGELYQEMAENATDPGVRVESLFQVGEMLFYQGMATEAEETYYQIIDEYKTSTWTNDALDRILIIGENNDFGGVPLSALAQTMYYARLGQIDRALRIANDAIEGFPESEARDNLLYEKASLQLRLGNPIEARSTADLLADEYPESAFAPRGLKIVADYYRELTGGEETAKTIYTDILLRFPKSIEIPEVRGRLNVLEGRGVDSSAIEGGKAHPWLG
ncbi:MAG: tetratricopeptide repeat protein [Candidatus Eisenbacteria bacterium]